MKEKKQKQKSGNIGLAVIAIILVIIISISGSISWYAWSKYQSAKSGNTNGDIAQWNFILKPGDTEISGITDFVYTRTDGYAYVVEGLLAPGTYGAIPITLDTRGTDVLMRADIILRLKDCPKNINFYPDKSKTEGTELEKVVKTVDEEEVVDITVTKYYSLEESADNYVDKEHEETIYWNWPYETLDENDSVTEGDDQDKADNGKKTKLQITAIGTQILEIPEPYVMIGETKIKKSEAGNYYGKQVDYSAGEEGTTWRLFYIDYDNKYGDGEGTIYLKADYKSSRTKTLSDYYSTYTSSSDTKIEEMNPLWAEQRAGSSVTWKKNEQAAAYLCDIRQWASYATDSKYQTYINYAIGAPSVEMYIDSYNQSGIDSKKWGYRYYANGYKYIVDNTEYVSYTGDNSLKFDLDNNRDKTTMYTNSAKSSWWWLASPSARDDVSVCNVYADILCLYCCGCGTDVKVCPVVSLQSNIPLEFSE